jgi:hypothetical protein
MAAAAAIAAVMVTPTAAQASAPTTVTPMTSRTVSPRVYCGGFNGHVSWDHQDISVWGELWETCGGKSYLYLSWNDPAHWNEQQGGWVQNGTTGINARVGTMLSPSNIAVTVCNTYGGWHCGSPQHV